LTDLGPFFERHDRRNHRVMVAATCASVALSATIAIRLLTSEAAASLRGVETLWGTGVVFTPIFIVAWWAFGAMVAVRRRKRARADGSHSLGPVDAGNGMRIADAGFVYSLVVVGAMLAAQVSMALLVFGLGRQIRGDWISRAIMLTVGAAAIYFGNIYPRMPVSRSDEHKAALRMKVNRYSGWFVVIVGLGIFLWGLLLPYTPHAAVPGEPAFVPSRHKEITLPAAELDKFVGRYDFGNGFSISVKHDGATLWVLREHSPAARAAPIYPEGPREFFWKAVEAQIRFTTDANGAVTGAEFREVGGWQPGKRLPP